MSGWPPRRADGHKGRFGTVGVVGGEHSTNSMMVGAPALAAHAALRSGCGRVVLAAPRSMMGSVLSLCPSATGRPLPQVKSGAVDGGSACVSIAAMEQEVHAIAFGPGIGRSDGAAAMLAHLLSVAGPALVVDADGLRLAPLHRRRSSDRPLIATPHPGEFRVLATAYGIPDPSTDESSRGRAAKALAHAIDAIVVLKGPRTVVASTDQVWTCQVGGVELAIPGSGDVLTGIIVSLLAQQWADTGAVLPFDAAQVGVQTHAQAGRVWRATHGERGLLAMELAGCVPQAVGCDDGIN